MREVGRQMHSIVIPGFYRGILRDIVDAVKDIGLNGNVVVQFRYCILR